MTTKGLPGSARGTSWARVAENSVMSGSLFKDSERRFQSNDENNTGKIIVGETSYMLTAYQTRFYVLGMSRESREWGPSSILRGEFSNF